YEPSCPVIPVISAVRIAMAVFPRRIERARGRLSPSSHPPVAIVESDDVVELGGRCLEDVGSRLGSHPMAQVWRDVEGVAALERHALERGRSSRAVLEEDASREDVNRLVLALVVLERQGVPGLDVEDLPHVAVGLRPDELPTPGFRYVTRHRALLGPPARLGDRLYSRRTAAASGTSAGSARTPE